MNFKLLNIQYFAVALTIPCMKDRICCNQMLGKSSSLRLCLLPTITLISGLLEHGASVLAS